MKYEEMQLVGALRYIRMVSGSIVTVCLGFFIDLTRPAAQWRWDRFCL